MSEHRPSETSKQYGRKLWELLSTYTGNNAVVEDAPERVRKRPDLKPVTGSSLLKVLQVFPTLLLFTFGASFFWDFEGMEATFGSVKVGFEGILRIVSVSGLIGFGTNWLAITMLFRPEKRRPVLGHGLIPSQKEVIAFRLAQAVSTDLINPELIKQKIAESNMIPVFRDKAISWLRGITDDANFRAEIKILAVDYMRDLVADPSTRSTLAANIIRALEQSISSKKLEKIALQTYLMVRGNEAQEIVEEAIARLPDNIERMLDKVDHTLDILPQRLETQADQIEALMTQLLYRLVNQLDVHTLIEENINKFEEQRLEKMIKGATNEQLRYIQYLGAILGAIGGLVIWSPVLALGMLSATAILIVGVDYLLIYLNRNASKAR